jgi:hypothetical protein
MSLALCNATKNTCIRESDIAKAKSKMEKEPKYIIQQFVIYGLKYRQIFETNNFAAIDNFNITNMSIRFGKLDLSMISKYMDFKKLWKQLDDRDKYELFNIMRQLCNYALKYKT